MDQCHQGQLLPEESVDQGSNTRPIELIPYLLTLEQNLMPVLPIVKQKKSKNQKENKKTSIVLGTFRIRQSSSCCLSTTSTGFIGLSLRSTTHCSNLGINSSSFTISIGVKYSFFDGESFRSIDSHRTNSSRNLHQWKSSSPLDLFTNCGKI